jgi:hypothetical protein
VIAYVDESIREGDSGLYYVVAAAVVLRSDVTWARNEMRKLLHAGEPYLHWHQIADVGRRREILARLAEVQLGAFAVVYYPAARRRQEEARRRALLGLMSDLTVVEGVKEIVLESRRPRLDRNDRITVREGRQSRHLPNDLTYSHVLKSQEPLLWAADVIAGVIGAHLVRRPDSLYDELRPALLRVRNIP